MILTKTMHDLSLVEDESGSHKTNASIHVPVGSL